MKEIWQYYKILNQKNSLWINVFKSELNNKLNALEHIVELGQISDIRQLSYTLYRNKNIEKQIWEAAAHIYLQYYSDGNHYDSLRECVIELNDIEFFESYENLEVRTILLSIASMNSNGYVREKAVKALIKTQHPIAIQFILYRISDWVEPIRKLAVNGIGTYMKLDYLPVFIKNLKTIENYKHIERIDLIDIYTKIADFISIENRQFVIQNFKKFLDTERQILSKYLLKKPSINNDELNLMVHDQHFLVRNELLNRIETLDETFIQILLRDKSAFIRLKTLYGIKNRPEFKRIIRDFVADHSERVRLFARYTLKEESLNFSSIYIQNLESGLQQIGSILGLAETGNKSDAHYFQRLLDHPQLNQYAFKALSKLNTEMAYQFALSHFETNSTGLRKVIFNFLTENFTQEVHSKARDLFQKSEDKTKIKLLKMFSKVGGWLTLPDIIIATADQNEEIRKIAVLNLNKWQSKSIQLFTVPSKNELAIIRTVLKATNVIHNTRNYFTINPLKTITWTIENL